MKKKICGKQAPKIANIYFPKLPVIMQSKFYAKKWRHLNGNITYAHIQKDNLFKQIIATVMQ